MTDDKLIIRDREQMEDLFKYRMKQFDAERIKNVTIEQVIEYDPENEHPHFMTIIMDLTLNYRYGEHEGHNMDLFFVPPDKLIPDHIIEAMKLHPDRYTVIRIIKGDTFRLNLISGVDTYKPDTNNIEFKK